MPNRRLDDNELARANGLLGDIRRQLAELSSGDKELLFAYRRKVAKELMYDERSKPMVTRALKNKMRKKQEGVCALCEEALPPTYCVLDRFKAVDGYVEANVRLICQSCDTAVQKERAYT